MPIFNKYNDEQTQSLFGLRMLNNIDTVIENIVALDHLDTSHYNVVEKMEQIPNKFKKITLGNVPRHTTSLKFSYAIRMAIAISVSGFITDYFDLDEGRWVLFTVLSVIVPIYEQSQKKMRDRIFATIVGAVIVGVLFSIFQGEMARSILLILAGYLMNYVKVYRYSTILVTISAIGAAVLAEGVAEFLTFERVGMVIFGVILALLINRFVFPYKAADANRDLRAMYDDTILSMLNELNAKEGTSSRSQSMKNLLIITTMIEDRLKLNNPKQHIEWLCHYRLAACTIYELYSWHERHGIDQEKPSANMVSVEELIQAARENQFNDLLVKLKQQITHLHDVKSRIALSMVLEIAMQVSAGKQARLEEG